MTHPASDNQGVDIICITVEVYLYGIHGSSAAVSGVTLWRAGYCCNGVIDVVQRIGEIDERG